MDTLIDSAVADLERQLDQFEDYVETRGRRYYEAGRVSGAEFLPHRVEATVLGTRRYKTTWLFAESEWRSTCTCPVSPECKHAYAVGLHILDRLRDPDAALRADVSVLLGAEELANDEASRPERAARSRPEAPARRAAAAERASAPARSTRGKSPRPAPGVEDLLPQIEEELRDWAARRTPRGTKRFRAVFEAIPSEQGQIEIRLSPRMTSTRLSDQERSLQQLSSLKGEARRHPGVLSSDQLDLLDTYLAKFDDHATSWYAERSRRGPLAEFLLRVMPSRDVVWDETIAEPLARRLGIVAGAPAVFDPTPVRLLPMVERRGAEAILEMHAVFPDGRRLPLSEVVHLTDREHGGSAPLGVVLVGGVFHPVGDALPAEVMSLLESIAPVRLDREKGEGVLRALVEAVPSAREAADALTQRHRVQPAILLRLDAEDWLQIRLFAHNAGDTWTPGMRVRLPQRQFEYSTAGVWHEARGATPEDRPRGFGAIADAATAPENADAAASDAGSAASDAPESPLENDPDAWFHGPDLESVAPAVEWLESLGAGAGLELQQRQNWGVMPARDLEVGWWIKVGPRTVEGLAEAWTKRPRGVHWFGNPEMRSLLSAERVVRMRVSAKQFGVDLLAVSAEWEAEGLGVTEEELEQLRSSHTPWVKLGSRWVRRDVTAAHDEVLDVLADLGVEAGAGEQRLTLWQLAQAKPESLAALEHMGGDPAAIAAVHALRARVAAFQGLPKVDVPPGLTGELRPYQRLGLDFLSHAASLGTGAVLADDMGLGKTVQALAWLLHERARTPDAGPCLVVCPASVVHNWQREAQQFAPSLRVLLLTSGAERHRLAQEIAQYDLVVTNYALLRRDVEVWRETPLFAAILDEAQNIKNPQAAVSHAARSLRATHRLALTGTPLENRALDLWSIMAFVAPGYLGSQQHFTHRYDRVNAPPYVRRLLSAKMRPVLLRRLKKEVAPELPDRIEERRDCEMTPGQRRYYLAELARARSEVETLAAGGGVSRHKIQILAALTRLRQICLHPQLAGGKAELGSGKFDALFELLEPLLAEGHKVLLFSQFVMALELVRNEMRERHIPHHWLTGSTTDRGRVVSQFESDPEACVFLISLRAGGTGLNLTAASYVVLFDPWWNPAVEAQAIDRTHRIGQDRTVIAYRLLASGTIEEKIWELQQRKGELARDVLGEDGFARSLDRDALEYLFAEG